MEKAIKVLQQEINTGNRLILLCQEQISAMQYTTNNADGIKIMALQDKQRELGDTVYECYQAIEILKKHKEI